MLRNKYFKFKYFKSKYLTDRKTDKEKTIVYNVIFYKKLLRAIKKEHFNNLDTKKVSNNITFWRTILYLFLYLFVYLFIDIILSQWTKTVFPQFSNKSSKSDKIILNEDVKTVSGEKELWKTFSTYFAIIVSDLKILNIHEDASDLGVIMTLC